MVLHRNNFLSKIWGKTKELLQEKNYRNIKSCEKEYEMKHNESIRMNHEVRKSRMEPVENMYLKRKILLGRMLFSTNTIKKRNPLNYYVDTNIFFIIAGSISIYSVFIYDFFQNRSLQTLANMFLFLFHVTRKSVHIIACFIHLIFIICQMNVLYQKKKKNDF